MSVLAVVLALLAGSAAVPTLEDLRSQWVDPNTPVSKHIPQQLGGSQRDLPTINNFYGSVGIAPEQVRPVDLFAVNALELPPYAGCGASQSGPAYGCGRLLVDGAHVAADKTQWAAYEALRMSNSTVGKQRNIQVSTAVRMAFEANSVLWTINVTQRSISSNSGITPVEVVLEIPGMVSQSLSDRDPCLCPLI